MKTSIIPKGKSSTFADYFKLNANIREILAFFDCNYRIESCDLPRKVTEDGRVDELKQRLEDSFPYVSLTNEVARREFLIAPVLMEAARLSDALIQVEYALEVDEQLKGTLDYFIGSATHKMLVVEAKNGDLTRGFVQMAVELVALDRWASDSPEPRLYGAVSVGDVWKFGFFDRSEKTLVEDLNTYSVPTDVSDVIAVLVGILAG